MCWLACRHAVDCVEFTPVSLRLGTFTPVVGGIYAGNAKISLL